MKIYLRNHKFIFPVAAALLLMGGCAPLDMRSAIPANLSPVVQTPRASTYNDLIALPRPAGKIVASVYNFRDQTGQYKPAPASSFSTAVTQGATAMLVNALHDSGWFVTLEREGLQNLLTERKIIRAALKKPNVPVNNADQLPTLLAANVLIEGGVVAYEANVKTGGLGVKYFGIGPSGEYRTDQVTVNVRAVDIRSGQILHSVMATKSILSREMRAGVFQFVEFKKLLELEAGVTTNEPAQLCVMAAIEAAVLQLIADGVKDQSWVLADPDQRNHPVLAKYSSTLLSGAN